MSPWNNRIEQQYIIAENLDYGPKKVPKVTVLAIQGV